MTNYSGSKGEIPSFYHPSGASEDNNNNGGSSIGSRRHHQESRRSSSGASVLPHPPMTSSSILSFSTMGPTSAPNNGLSHSPRRDSSGTLAHRSPSSQSSVPFSPPYSSPQQLFQSIAAAATSNAAAAAAAAAKRTRHRVDAGEPRGCFQQNFYNSYETKMLTDYNQQLLREMLVSKIGFEEDVKVNGCKKRKLYQPVKNENPAAAREGGSPGPQQVIMLPNHRREHSITPTPPMTNGNSWGSHPLPPHIRSTPLQQQLQQHPMSPPPPFPHQIPFQWKESFKNNILATIGDLIDAQFAAWNQIKEGALLNLPPQPRIQVPPPQVPVSVPQPVPPPPPRNFFPSVPMRQPPQGLSPPYPPPTDSPLSLVMTPNTKKKRHKVTDTRLTPRNVMKLDEDEKYFGKYDVSPPASLNDFVNSQLDDPQSDDTELSGGNEGTIRSSDGASPWSTNGGISSTLTPMHLRKAKLMFFWVRYPSSSVLKMYFPDIKFNKNNTAQLVKWFSNFREFYYIQMEKYARAALAEGVKSSDDIHITIDSELYRLLNLHYNRNNHIEVPSNFRYVVEQTLREFFKAIQNRKDAEQSWKKTIYKIIARLDDPVPENFKRAEFLETLE